MPGNGKHGCLLEATGLAVEYAGGQAAVKGVSFSLERGSAFGIVGGSGAGKTTVALAILGLLPTDAKVEGSLRFNGMEILGSRDVVESLKWTRIAIVLQDSMNVMNPVITVGEQIAEMFVFKRGLSWKEGIGRSQDVLESVGLDRDTVGRYPHQLSGGMRQRAVIAMAVALEPELLLVDEPTVALDVIVQNQVIDLLNRLRDEKGMGILMIAHDISAVARTCEHIAVMRDGLIVEQGRAGRILASPVQDYTRELVSSIPRLPEKKRDAAKSQ
jgi:peptide/nickel transport system ATP-binding protein